MPDEVKPRCFPQAWRSKLSRRQFNGRLLQLGSLGALWRLCGPSLSLASEDRLAVSNGQSINLTNVGRAGAAVYDIPNYSADLRTVEGDQTFSTDQTIRNTNFPGIVKVTGGNVVFEFCSFTAQPPSAGIAPGAGLQQYNGGDECGTVTCNWCDFDTSLRGTQGNSETEGFNAGERAHPITNRPASSFTLYRCRIQGFGNGISLDGWQCGPSYITECYIGDCTSGGGTHVDGIEIYSSDNIIVQRCRLVGQFRGQSLVNVTNDWGQTANSNPIIIRNNFILPQGDNAPILVAINNNDSNFKRNVSVIDNYFGDHTRFGFEVQLAGNEKPLRGLNVTFDQAFFDANQANEPGLIYWSRGNVWTPDGEGIRNPVGHKPGAFVGQGNFTRWPIAAMERSSPR
jgi:hypothetical protein